ncbi:hypothetical protein HELRODRAFT_178176 [Helobdella robusta]|uniref:Uncharacterized protein n=1 Tax=Helobdella robusta TaxID=6412 RepID=T1FCW3_HELRO|nr:hypothetical protein HELRODRAFT_178176 [Helobdella robusta]ESN97386.1 hypothetical protein HELRODRAFT_178176 [Helobdella robusta]
MDAPTCLPSNGQPSSPDISIASGSQIKSMDCITKITRKAREFNVDKSESFVGRLHSYWTLKRQSRDGYPLLNSRKFGENIKILNVNQFLAGPNEQQASSKEQENKDSHQPDDVEDDDSLENEITEVGSNGTKITQQSLETVNSKEKKADEMGASNEDVACKNSSDNDDVMSDVCEDDDDEYESFVEHLRISHMLRRDLEKVRLLIELVRKREKLKAEQIRVREKQFECELSVINEGAHAMVQIIDEILKHFSSFQSKKVESFFLVFSVFYYDH